eukprot:1310-Heterococcus_DN1.PRE.1
MPPSASGAQLSLEFGCTLSAIYGGLAVLDKAPTAITAMKIVVCGAGSAGLGVVSWLAKAMVKHGLSPEEAYVTSYHMPERAMLYAQTYVRYFTYFRSCMNCSELPCARRKWIDNTSQRLNAR